MKRISFFVSVKKIEKHSTGWWNKLRRISWMLEGAAEAPRLSMHGSPFASSSGSLHHVGLPQFTAQK